MTKTQKKVLLVDDDPALRQLLSVVLSKSGYAVECAHDGFSALAAIREAVPDILLSDFYMPEMSGFELLPVVRRRFPEMAVVAMSSAYTGNSVPAGIAADAFYAKATNLGDLLGYVSDVGGQRDEKAERRKRASSPVWIARTQDDTESTQIALGCPECMRTFFEETQRSEDVIRETACLHCSTRVQYAMVQAAN